MSSAQLQTEPSLSNSSGRWEPYALRDATGTVESIPLIASSIHVEEACIKDFGCAGSRCQSEHLHEEAGEKHSLAQRYEWWRSRTDGQQASSALITNIDQPLAIGNALEVMEVSQTLQNVRSRLNLQHA